MSTEQGDELIEHTYEALVQLTYANDRAAIMGSMHLVTLVFVVIIAALVLARVVRR